jgi:hypothetical protein
MKTQTITLRRGRSEFLHYQWAITDLGISWGRKYQVSPRIHLINGAAQKQAIVITFFPGTAVIL